MVTLTQVENWLGSDCTRDNLVEMIMQIANNEYLPEELKQDIQDYFINDGKE